MRRYPQPHSLRKLAPEPYATSWHHAFKQGGDDTSIVACVLYARNAIVIGFQNTNPRNMNNHRGGIYPRDGR